MSTDILPPTPVITEATPAIAKPLAITTLLPHTASQPVAALEHALKTLPARAPLPQPIPNPNEAVLIALLVDYEKSKWILEELTGDHFGSLTPEKKIFDIILAVEKSGQSVGIPTVLDRCPDEPPANKEWAAKRFEEWKVVYAKGADLHSAVDALKQRRKKNQVSALLKKGADDLNTLNCEPNAVAAEVAEGLDGLTGSSHVATVSQSELNESTLRSLTSEPAPIFSTGFLELDKRIGGISPSRTYLIASRTGVGKSAFLLNLLHSLGRQNIRTGFISLEMDRVGMNKRLYGITGGLEARQLKWPVSPETLTKIQEVIAETNAWPVYWSDKRGMTLIDLKSKLSQFGRQGCQVAFVDYIQRIVVEGNEPRHLQVAKVAKTLADLAERLNMAIVVASQINREGAKMDAAPELHNISESTVIEESADVILLLSNKKKEDESQGRNRPMSINVAKNRHGFGGRFDMFYCGRQFKFSGTSFQPPPMLGAMAHSPTRVAPCNTSPPPVPKLPALNAV